jgi:thiamine biosynthesis protein ThiI
MYRYLLISVDELWLKGKNRQHYFQAISQHILLMLKKTHEHKVKLVNHNQRLIIQSDEPFSEEVIEALTWIPGLYSITPALLCDTNLEAMIETAITELGEKGHHKRFKVEVSRVDKNFPLNSMETAREIGHHLLNRVPGMRVDLHAPELIVDIRILQAGTFVASWSRPGVGGLPVGTSGQGLTLLSGGFDSPVASYMLARRGLAQDFVFFHAYPFVGDDVVEKIIALTRRLAVYQKGCRLYIVPFGPIQDKIARTCRQEYRTILFRKAMIDAANVLGDQFNAEVLVTGDSLGQVSSQTLANMALVEQGSKRLLLRPLVGVNKRETLSLARKIKTHDLSLIPHDDACALFAPKHPIIRPDSVYWASFHAENDFSSEILSAVQNARKFSFDLLGRDRNRA